LKTVVITGARGYIGSALALSLTRRGHALRLVSRSLGKSSDGATAKADYIQADLRDEESWLALLKGADAVVHLSSRTDLRAAEADPAGDHVLNVEPVHALVRAAERSRNAVPVVFASSTTIVGETNVRPVNEQTPDHPCSVYDRHKLECEITLREATQRGLLRACSLRLSTVYGYGNGGLSINPNRGILNTVIRGAANGEPPTIYGEGRYVRDYIFVGDVVDAFCRALEVERVCDGKHYVIATGRGYTLAEAFSCVAQEAHRATGRKVEIRHVPEPPDLHPIQKRSFIGDSQTFQQLTGWRPRVDLRSGIREYFERLGETQNGGTK
jgi:nucleoside-diphosphate-sugar epimerase